MEGSRVAGDQGELVAALFDRTADTYDRTGVELFQPIADRLVAELAPRTGERALDVGCGRGAALFMLARAVGPEGRAVGVDLSPRMVAATAKEATDAGLRVVIRVGDAQKPPFEDEVFDLVASSLVIFFLPDPLAALRAWRELLVPEGRVGVSTFGDFSPAWKEVDKVFAAYIPTQMADPRTQSAETPFASDAGVERLLVEAGFTDVRTTTVTVPVRFDDAEHWERWTWSVGQRRMWEAVPADERRHVREAAYAQLDRCRDGDGRIGFDQVARFTLGRR
jgi:ubiquinone/menaquinone biosynthesis C-methylase UbiE